MSHAEYEKAVLASFFEELYIEMSEAKWRIVANFAISCGILYAVLMNAVVGWVGVGTIGLIMGIDVPRAVKAWRRARENIEAEKPK